MSQKIPLSKCFFDSEAKQAAIAALDSGRYILGPECDAFEKELAAYTGTKQAVLSTSWTMAVYLWLEAIGFKAGDEVLVPSHTAFPSIEPLVHRGGIPVFIDINDFYCIDEKALAAAVTPRTVGIIPVHIYGHPCEMDTILAFAKERKLWVLEDCAQSQGASYKGKQVGSMGDAGAFSFYPSKNLTVLGDGGFISTNDDKVAERMRMMRNHGRKDKYRHQFFGWNLRFNEVQAAVGRVALRHLNRLNDGRRAVAARYREKLAGLVALPPEIEGSRHVYHMFVIRVADRDKLAAHLKDKGIETGIHYPVPNHLQPAVTDQFPQVSLPKTEAAVDAILSLPIHGEMSLDDADRVCAEIKAFLGAK